MDIDYDAAYEGYLERFDKRFGDQPLGHFVKFERTMVQKLAEAEFKARLDAYVKYHRACKRMLESGATISDALVLDFVESAAWVAVQAPDIHTMFRGEMGDPSVAAPSRASTSTMTSLEITSPDVRTAASASNATRPRITEIDDIIVGGGDPRPAKK